MSQKAPLKVVITGAAGNIGGYASFFVAQGAMGGPDQPIDLRLLEIPQAEKALNGALMELNDGAFPLIHSVICTTDYKVAFQDVDVALLIGAKPRGPGMQRKDLLKANAKIFEGQGKALDRYASRNVKVLVVGNPANTNAYIAMKSAPDIPAKNFTAMCHKIGDDSFWNARCHHDNEVKVRIDRCKRIVKGFDTV